MKRAYATVLIPLVMSTLISITNFRVKAGWSGGTITINPDGLVEPNDAPVRRDGDTYVLTDDIEAVSGYGIVIERDNVVIDGNNHLLKGEDGVSGVYLDNRRGVTIKNIRIQNFFYGILLWDSSSNKMIRNSVDNNYIGIYLQHSSNNEVIWNRFINCGLGVWESYNNTVRNNTVNGKPLTYLEEKSGERIKDAGQVVLVRCSNIIIENLDLSNTSIGVELWETTSSTIKYNNIRKNKWGIYLAYSSANKITGNNIENNEYGISLYDSSDNKIHRNDFENNGKQVYISRSVSTWDNDFGGNYWYDYDGVDVNGDGFGDTPYIVDMHNKDNYPSIRAYMVFISVSTSYGIATGSGLYEVGSTVIVSVTPTVIEKGFFTNCVFEGWKVNGNAVSTSPTYSFTVDKPVNLVASWRMETKPIIIGLIAGVVLQTIIVLTILMIRTGRGCRCREVKRFVRLKVLRVVLDDG